MPFLEAHDLEIFLNSYQICLSSGAARSHEHSVPQVLKIALGSSVHWCRSKFCLTLLMNCGLSCLWMFLPGSFSVWKVLPTLFNLGKFCWFKFFYFTAQPFVSSTPSPLCSVAPLLRHLLTGVVACSLLPVSQRGSPAVMVWHKQDHQNKALHPNCALPPPRKHALRTVIIFPRCVVFASVLFFCFSGW